MTRRLDSAQEAMLQGIEEKHNQSTIADYELDEMILAAHASGVSWERIGLRLGISRQSAAEKYGAMERKREADLARERREQVKKNAREGKPAK